MSEITWKRGVEDLVSLMAKLKQPAWFFTILFTIEFSEPRSRKSKLLALFVLHGPVIFPFLTDCEKMYLIQWFVNVETSIILQDRDENLCNPRLAPIIRFTVLCKDTYLKGNVTPRPISDRELDVIPMIEGLPVHKPKRSEMISMLNDLHRLGGNKRRLAFWIDPVNTRVLRIFIMACRKNQIVQGEEILSHILCYRKAV